MVRICFVGLFRQQFHQPLQRCAFAQVLLALPKLPLDTLGRVFAEIEHLRQYEGSPKTVVVVQMNDDGVILRHFAPSAFQILSKTACEMAVLAI